MPDPRTFGLSGVPDGLSLTKADECAAGALGIPQLFLGRKHLAKLAGKGYHPRFVIRRCPRIQSDNPFLQVDLLPFERKNFTLAATCMVGKYQYRSYLDRKSFLHAEVLIILKEALPDIVLL